MKLPEKRRAGGRWGMLPIVFCWSILLSVGQTQVFDKDKERWIIADSWRQPEGLSQDNVITLAQTKDGYIWIGTRGGISRFDGLRFTNFDDSNQSQLRENEVWGLAEGSDSSLWIGTYGGGLSRLKDSRFTIFTAKDGLVDDFVRVLVRDAAGFIWAGTDNGLSCFREGIFANYTKKQGLAHNTVRALYPDRDGSLWIATQEGVIQRWREGKIETIALPGAKITAFVEALLRDSRGTLWIATQDGLLQFSAGTTIRYTTGNGLSSNRVRRLLEDQRGRLWVATDRGLDQYLPGSNQKKPFISRATTADIIAILGDREGNIWLGYRGRGLARFQQVPFFKYTEEDGLPASEVSAVYQDRKGTVWVGTSRGLGYLRAGDVHACGLESGIPVRPVSSIVQSPDGRLWVGSEGGLFRSREPISDAQQPGFQSVPGPHLLTNHVRALHLAQDGSIWVGTNLEGLARIQQDVITVYTVKEGLSGNEIRSLAEDRDGAVWIGTKGAGLSRFKDGTFTLFSMKDGLLSDGIQCLYVDQEGALWIGTRKGLCRRKNGVVTSFSVKQGLYANHIYGLVEDGRGYLWMGCGKGIFLASLQQLRDFAAGKIAVFHTTQYGHEYGISGSVAVGHNPVVLRTLDDRVWFATLEGLVVVEPTALSTSSIPPLVHLEEVTIDQHPYPVGQSAEAPPGSGDMTFRYTALSFEAPEKIQFKYKLEGFDTEWRDAGTWRVANYTNVPPGSYRFQIIACNKDGIWNETGTDFTLRLSPHIYQTYWFYGLCALIVALAGAATQRLHVIRLKRRERELAARVHDALAQIKILSGLLPICASCKNIRDDKGYWQQMESYIREHSEVEFSHGICPECMRKLYPNYAQRKEQSLK